MLDPVAPDWARMAPLAAAGLERAAPAALAGTAAGERVRVEAYAPGIVRVRLGEPCGADYGLVAEPAPDGEAGVHATADGWAVTSGAARLAVGGDPVRLALGDGSRNRLASTSDAHFTRSHRLPPVARTDSGWVCAFDLAPAEPVYGLGEKWGPLNHRGQLLRSKCADALGVNAELSYKNTPFAWSPEGWAVFVNTPASVQHGVGYAQWSARSYTLAVEDDVLDLFLIVAADGAGVLERYTWLTGRMPAIPEWSLGVWFSRAYYRDADELLSVARELRREEIPCDVITLDGRAWLDTRTRFAFEWDSSRYPDPAAVTAQLHELGYRLCVWEYPLVSTENPLFAYMAERGWLLRNDAGEAYRYQWDPAPFGGILTPLPESGLVDFTHPQAYAYWRDRHSELFADGVDVIKSDFGEQVPADARAANGDSGRRLHNVYPLLYNACVYEGTAAHGRSAPAMVFGRAGWAGSQRYPIQWGGDPQADWHGLAGSIRGALNWGLSGGAAYATDIGGYYGDTRDPELFVRWAQAGVFASHMRFHGIGEREPWSYGAEAERHVRAAIALRYRLIPYVRGCLDQASKDGLPVMRAMVLACPHDPAAWAFETQYLFGPDLLVAPVLSPDRRVTVYLPAGESWCDFEDGTVYAGGQCLHWTMPLARIPVFVRAGTTLALGPVVTHTGELAEGGRIADVVAYGCDVPRPPCLPAELGAGVTRAGPASLRWRGLGPGVGVTALAGAQAFWQDGELIVAATEDSPAS